MIIASSQLVAKPLVSVVIATYNQVKYIEQTVMSALTQQCPFPFEVVVGDDGSNDGERELLKKLQEKYPENLKLIFNDKNMMVTRNYVNAIHEARGKYIATLDGDDYYLVKDALVKLVDVLEKNEDISLVHGGFHAFDNKTGKVLSISTKWESPMLHTKGINSVLALLCNDFNNYPLGSSSCFRKNIYEEGCIKYKKLIDLSDKYIGEGTILNVSMAMSGKFGYVPEELTAYRVLDTSLCHYKSKEESFRYFFGYVKLRLHVAEMLEFTPAMVKTMLSKTLKQELNRAKVSNLINLYIQEVKSLKNIKNDVVINTIISENTSLSVVLPARIRGCLYTIKSFLKKILKK